MRTITGVDPRRRTREGWIALPLLIRGLEEAERVCVHVAATHYIVGHAARSSGRWWLIPDWRAHRADLSAYEPRRVS